MTNSNTSARSFNVLPSLAISWIQFRKSFFDIILKTTASHKYDAFGGLPTNTSPLPPQNLEILHSWPESGNPRPSTSSFATSMWAPPMLSRHPAPTTGSGYQGQIPEVSFELYPKPQPQSYNPYYHHPAMGRGFGHPPAHLPPSTQGIHQQSKAPPRERGYSRNRPPWY
ncbi:hypothetical protein B0T14DRAFT_224819 [Immersiella caudata]|uniref:Uncharacterized protein n=1 Tax=Immersiella caudata TaxID=314043 RepID=A0AA39WRB3_9PEZI|nr:hypothetical protein B0T14DRAFT_224819 [Immersiella caudata]